MCIKVIVGAKVYIFSEISSTNTNIIKEKNVSDHEPGLIRFNIFCGIKPYFTIATSSSDDTSVCSPVAIFFRVSLPSAISDSPASATNGTFLALA